MFFRYAFFLSFQIMSSYAKLVTELRISSEKHTPHLMGLVA